MASSGTPFDSAAFADFAAAAGLDVAGGTTLSSSPTATSPEDVPLAGVEGIAGAPTSGDSAGVEHGTSESEIFIMIVAASLEVLTAAIVARGHGSAGCCSGGRSEGCRRSALARPGVHHANAPCADLAAYSTSSASTTTGTAAASASSHGRAKAKGSTDPGPCVGEARTYSCSSGPPPWTYDALARVSGPPPGGLMTRLASQTKQFAEVQGTDRQEPASSPGR